MASGEAGEGTPRADGKPAADDEQGNNPPSPADQGAPADRPGQFSDPTSDPFADSAAGADNGGVNQAYRTWGRTMQTSGGPATVVTESTFRDVNVGTTTINLASRREQLVGRVRPDVLDELAERYLPVSGYAELLSRLKSTRLVALRGAPETGRVTTGLRLLAEVCGGGAWRFDRETDLWKLTADELKDGLGYLFEMTPGRAGAIPSDVQADWLRDLLHSSRAYMVIVVDRTSRFRSAFSGYAADCPPPEAGKLLNHAIEWECAGHAETIAAAVAAAATLSLSQPAAERPPGETWRLAKYLVAHARGEITIEAVTQSSDVAVQQRVATWFDPLADIPSTSQADEPVRLAAFRISLAIFNDSPYDLVAEAGELLAREFLITRSPHRSPGRIVFANFRNDDIAASHAQLFSGIAEFQRAGAPAAFAGYIDRRLPAEVLRHTWNLHNARGPVISWLQQLSRDSRPAVWMRAALAIGLLSSWDFSYTFHELIHPWASAGDDVEGGPRRRRVAAVALDEASRSDEVLPVVRETIDSWCSSGTTEQRQTAAAAYGYSLGSRNVGKSLKNLKTVGSWNDGELASEASWAIARIFSHGGISQVIQTLENWLSDERRSVRELALLTLLRIGSMKAGDIDDLDPITAADGFTKLADRENWPLILALSAEDPALTDPLADLYWQVTRSAAAHEPALKMVASWMRAAGNDRTCTRPAARFLALVGDDEDDRKRLIHLVDVVRKDRDEPLPADLADIFALAIETNRYPGSEKGPG